MLYHFVLLKDLIEDLHGPAAIDHEILGNDFEPVDHRLAAQNMLVMRRAQPDADSVLGKIIKLVGAHESSDTGND